MSLSIPVIDLFAGAGGLGEGFSQHEGRLDFDIQLSVEMNPYACETLRGRKAELICKKYGYAKDITSLLSRRRLSNIRARGPVLDSLSQALANDVDARVLQAEMGKPDHDYEIERRMTPFVGRDSVVIGGPPCQAYSLAGRVKNNSDVSYTPEGDHRNFLYKEYLKYLALLRPAVFVMENVKGLLSAKVGGQSIIDAILKDLSAPKLPGQKASARYHLYPLVGSPTGNSIEEFAHSDAREFLVKSEEFGVPQSRHRVILLGVREDIKALPSTLSEIQPHQTVEDAIGDLPKIRPGLTESIYMQDDFRTLMMTETSELMRCAKDNGDLDIAEVLQEVMGSHHSFTYPYVAQGEYDELNQVYNHNSRPHMLSDLRRYLYVSAFTACRQRSPKGPSEFTYTGLAPNHKNWEQGTKFVDRFRCQGWKYPSHTITSHLEKDGHHFIHPDSGQARSMSVREAARIQTFSDSHFFEGPQGAQYRQVGNAVPPRLARQIAVIVEDLLIQKSAGQTKVL